MSRLQRGWIVVSLMALCGMALAQEPSSPSLRLEIDSQPLGAALNEFARQSGLQVFLRSEDSNDLISPRISGNFTPQAALEKLLANTGLEFEYLSARTVAIRPVTAADSATAIDSVSAKKISAAGRS